MLLLVLSVVVASFSQILLKKSADETAGKEFLQKLWNRKVILAYAIFGLVFFINLYAYRGVNFKYGGVIQSIGQVFVLALSVLFCHERLTRNRILGNVLILCGVVLYSLQ